MKRNRPAGWHEAVPVVIYAIETADHRVKIGATRNLYARALDLRSEEKCDLVVRAAYVAPSSEEGDLHRRLNALRGRQWMRGPDSEWYPLDIVASWLDGLPADRRRDLALPHRGRSAMGAPLAELVPLQRLSRCLSASITRASIAHSRLRGAPVPWGDSALLGIYEREERRFAPAVPA